MLTVDTSRLLDAAVLPLHPLTLFTVAILLSSHRSRHLPSSDSLPVSSPPAIKPSRQPLLKAHRVLYCPPHEHFAWTAMGTTYQTFAVRLRYLDGIEPLLLAVKEGSSKAPGATSPEVVCGPVGKDSARAGRSLGTLLALLQVCSMCSYFNSSEQRRRTMLHSSC